jgi:hypothetical protein
MREGLNVRRDWYYNDQLWLSREESWDYSKYGASGTIRDISVYELDAGLLSGSYRFELYIDSKPQPIFGGVSWPTFTVTENEFREQLVSPAGYWMALIHDPTLLSIVDPNGNVQEVYSGTEIANLAWLPDGRHLVFVDRDRSRQNGAGMGTLDDLWIVDVATGQTLLLYPDNGPLLKPLIIAPGSGSGYLIAGVEGSGYADACGVDARLVIFEVSQAFEVGSRYDQEDFTGLPGGQDIVAYPSEQGQWSSDHQFRVPMDFTCTTDTSLKGSYIFDLNGMSVVKE